MKRFAIVAAELLALVSLLCHAPAQAAMFNQYIGFGDSTQDSGYFRYNTTGNAASDAAVAAAVAKGASGAFVGPGMMNSIIFAGKFGLNGGPVGVGGTNFANGGAFTAPLRASASEPFLSGVSYPTNVSTNQQIQNYLASVGGVANSRGVYMVKTGDNDLNFVRIIETIRPGWLASNPTFLHDINLGLASNVAALQAAGARTIIVPNSYNYAVFAGLGGYIPESNAALYARSNAYNLDRWATLSQTGVRFIPADIDSLMKFVVIHPTLFGFTPSSVLSANALAQAQSPLLVSWAEVTPEQMQTSLFVGANGVHFTTAGQQIEADYDANLLTAPTQMSLLAEGPVQGGLSRAATIQGQMDLSEQNRGANGINIWASGGLSSLQIKSYSGFSNESGTPFTGVVGADYRTSCGLVVGAAFAAGTQTQNFSRGAGSYDQNDQAVSLYTAYRYGSAWGDAVASYGFYQDKISRNVPLGLFMDHNSGNTTGDSLGLALRLGGDMKWGLITTGPVAGLILQRVTIKGFSESGTSGVTALSYGEQTRDSTVSQLGWRILADVGRFQPFAEAKWNHEFQDSTRKVKASLTTIAAPSYSIDAVPVTSDWGTLMLGSSFKLSERVMLRASFSSMFSDPNRVNYGGEFGVNVNF